MLPKKFFTGLGWLILLNILIKPVWIFFIDRPVQNIVGHESYGTYFALLNLSLVLAFIADAGITNMMNQRVASGSRLNTSKLLLLKIAFSVLYALIVISVAALSSFEQMQLLYFLIAIQVLSSFFLFFRALITAHQAFRADAFISVIDKLLVTILCIPFIYFIAQFKEIDLQLFLQLQLISLIVSILVCLLVLIKLKALHPGVNSSVKGMLQLALPFALVIFLMAFHSRADAYLLRVLHPDGALQAGIYATAFRLLDAANMVGYLVASFLVPYLARNGEKKDLVKRTIKDIQLGLLFFSLGISAFSIFYASWIQELLYHSKDSFNSDVIRFSLLVLPAYMIIHIYGSALTAAGELNLMIKIFGLAVIINLILNLVLIEELGALGSALAALCSQYFSAAACYLLASRRLDLQGNKRSWLLYGIVASLLLLLFYIGQRAMINVWLILALAVLALVLLLLTQLSTTQNLFIKSRHA